jgi:hypothetical protein
MGAERTEGSTDADAEERGPARSASASASEAKSVLVRIAPGLEVTDAVGQTLLAAVVAWSATVAPAVLSRSAPRSAALVALLALVSGALEPLRLDPLRASIGAVAWGAFALSWREPWDVETSVAEAPEPGAALLQARSALPRGAVAIMTVGVMTGLGFLVLAWNVRDGDRALMAHAVSVACAVAIIAVAGSAAVDRGKRSPRSSRRVTSTAGRALLLLFTFVAAGIAVVMLRR